MLIKKRKPKPIGLARQSNYDSNSERISYEFFVLLVFILLISFNDWPVKSFKRFVNRNKGRSEFTWFLRCLAGEY